MNCVVVNDASCLIDLYKGRLLHALLKLPYQFVVPLPIRESEVLNFTEQEWQLLEDGGLETFDLPPNQMSEVARLKADNSRLSVNDCFCVVTTQCHQESMLLTGDALLRRVAEGLNIEVHGVLWVIDELHRMRLCESTLLINALEIWQEDKAVFLPNSEIKTRLRKLRRTIHKLK